MSSSDNPQKGGLWARLFGVSAKEAPPKERADKPAEGPSPLEADPAETIPLATPAGAALADATVPLAEPVAAPPGLAPESPTEELPPEDEDVAVETAPELCPSCRAPRKGTQSFCDDCGWMFPAAGAPGAAAAKPARRS